MSILSIVLAAMETTLSTIEASGVIALRLEVILNGGAAAEAEVELMVTEKIKAFTQVASDIAGGSSLVQVYENLQSAIRANYDRLSQKAHVCSRAV
jgi:hypothetical protein